METDNNQVSEQSNDLFSYIGGQGFQATDDTSLVEQMASDAPVTISDQDGEGNVDQAASQQSTAQGLTTPQQGTQQQPQSAPATQASQEAGGDEALRLQERVRDLETREQKMLTAFALMASQAKEREERLFEASLESMTDDEAQRARDARDREKIESENAFLKAQVQKRRQDEAASEEMIDKTTVAHKLLQRLGLPADDNFVMTALMESESPAEMFAKANRMARVFRQNENQANQTVATTLARTNAHVAGGETAPAVPPKRVAQRTGELVDMMRERQYTSEAIT